MSQDQTFRCTNCGAPQDYKGGSAATIQCPYCNTTLIVPASLRTPDPNANRANPFDWNAQAGALTEIKNLLDGGNKIAAIKLFREKYGTGLKEAKDAVEAIERGENLAQTLSGFNFSTIPATAVQITSSTSTGCVNGVIALVILVVVASVVIPILVSVGALTAILPGGDTTTSVTALRTAVSGLPVTPTPRATVTPIASPTPQFANVVSQFGSPGTGAGKMNDARAITVDNNGHVFVAEYLGGRIQVFDAAGKFQTQCLVDAKTALPSMAADRRGNLFVIENSTIVQFDAATCTLRNTYKPAAGVLYKSLAIGADGMLYATMSGNFKDSIVRLDANGHVTVIVDNAIGGQISDFELDPLLAIDGQGNFYDLGVFANQIFKFDRSGKFVTTMGSRGDEPGQFMAIDAFAVDSQGRLYVGDNKGVQVFAPDGRYLAVFHIPTSVASGMAFDDNDNLWITARTVVYRLGVGK